MRLLPVAVVASVVLTCPALEALDPIAQGVLEIRGSELTIYSADGADDASQVLNVGEHARVRTCYGAIYEPCGAVAAGDPRTKGLRVVAELSGPELVVPVEVETVPGGTFVLPGFQQPGEYLLYNIRLIEVATGRLVTHARPGVAVLRVEEIVLTSATVTALSLADLAALGVEIDGDNIQGFNFAVGFLFAGELVTLEMPVLFDGTGIIEVAGPAEVNLDNVTDGQTVDSIHRWTPPVIVPFQLSLDPERLLSARGGGIEEISFPLVGAVVFPGNVTFLNQFFEARLIVANGASSGSGAVLRGLEAELSLPGGGVLRLAETDPPQAVAGGVPVLDGSSGADIGPGNQGTAAWILEALTAGTHVVRMDIAGELERPGRDPLPLKSAAQAVVDVADPRFHLTFGHPDVVREGSAYTLFVTVANLSRATQNLVSVAIDGQHITGAHQADPDDDLVRTIETLPPGAAATVEYRMVADVTGRIFASVVDIDSGMATGSVQLYTGVGELGIPLSPATLKLPRFSERLAPAKLSSDELYRWNVRLLGLAYSLAVAPPSAVPRGLPRVVTSDVVRRASDLAQAGRRLFLDEEPLASLEILMLEQLGNRVPVAEYDELRRRTDVGLSAARALGSEIAAQRDLLGLTNRDLVEHLAESAGYRPPFVAVLAEPVGAAAGAGIEVVCRDDSGNRSVLAGAAGSVSTVREVPFAEMFELPSPGGAQQASSLAVVARFLDGASYDLIVRNSDVVPATARIRIVLPGDASGFRIVDLGDVTIDPHSVAETRLWPDVADAGFGGFELTDLATGLPLAGAYAPTQREAQWPLFTLVGARQDFGLGSEVGTSIHGNTVAYLFNRPVDDDLLDASSFGFWSRFVGHPADDDVEVVDVEAEVRAEAAFVQDGGRVVLVRYRRPLPALVDPATGGPLLEIEHRLDPTTLMDGWGEPLNGPVPPPRIEDDPLHVGGLVAGRVVDGTGAGVAGATVQLLRRGRRLHAQQYYLVGATQTDVDGRFLFEFVEEPPWHLDVLSGYVLRATVPEGPDPDLQPAQVREVRSIIRRQNRLARVNIALLGRGTVAGTVRYDDGQPVTDPSITVYSTLFNEVRSGVGDAAGQFSVAGVPVGPITVAAVDGGDRTGYATVGIDGPGTTTTTVVTVPREDAGPSGTGSVLVRVLVRPSGDPDADPTLVHRADVAVYTHGQRPREGKTNALGQALFERVPAGQITAQAASWDLAQAPAISDAFLAADTTLELDLVLAEAELRTVVGQVVVLDPVTAAPSPVEGAAVFISGPGVLDYTDADGRYRLEGVPTQRSADAGYAVSAISYELRMEGAVALPPVLATSPELIEAVPIELQNRRGGLRGHVLDPLGSPVADAEVISHWYSQVYRAVATAGNGTFSFGDLPLGDWDLVAHDGDGLQPGRVGHFGEVKMIGIEFGGHTPNRTVQFVGSGVVRVSVGAGRQVPVFIRPQCYRSDLKGIGMAPTAVELQTDPTGWAELEVPVGLVEVVAMDYFGGGRKAVTTTIDWPGQVKVVDLEFDEPSVVLGRVVDVDGVTPVPGFEIELTTGNILPRPQTADALGEFRFELVELGMVQVTARGSIGAVERVGSAVGAVYTGGETVDLTIRLEAQGSVRGRVVRWNGSEHAPVPNAHVRLREGDFPFERQPITDTWAFADAAGWYEFSGVHQGGLAVIARDPTQVHLQGSTNGRLERDWEVVELPDLVLSDLIGRLEIEVRDPDTGAPLPDSQVSISGGAEPEGTVAGADGVASFEALRLGGYSVYAFHAPTGRGGRLGYVELSQAGATVRRTLYVNLRGEICGTLWDDQARTMPAPGWNVDLQGQTAVGPMSAVSLTSGRSEEVGRFAFGGIPEGDFRLEAGHWSSPRRASAEMSLTPTAPIVDVDLVLEEADDLHVRLFESLGSGLTELDPSRGTYSVRLLQPDGSAPVYDFTTITPAAPSPGHVFILPGALLDRQGELVAQEWTGEQRKLGVRLSTVAGGGGLAGSGTAPDPYQLVLHPKGVVRVTTLDAQGLPVSDAEVVLASSGGNRQETLAGDDGVATFVAVPAGNLVATANAPFTASAGRADGVLRFDDEVVDLTVHLQPMVSATGVVYLPTPDDAPVVDPATLAPAAGVIVGISYGAGLEQTVLTDEEGRYRFDALEAGPITLDAQDVDGLAVGGLDGALGGPHGTLHVLPELILDGFPPRILGIVPPPGMAEVSRSAVVEIAFSEQIPAPFLPDDAPMSGYFRLTRPRTDDDGPGDEPVDAIGTWDWYEDGLLRPVVRFTPDGPLADNTTYSLAITTGTVGVTDLAGRMLSSQQVIGSSFTTADETGPVVLATVPSLEVPFDPEGTIRFDFNEGLFGTDAQLGGDPADDAAAMFWGRDNGHGGWDWKPLPVSMILTRSNYSMVVDPDDSLLLTDDSLARRVEVTALRDANGNEMAPFEAELRIRDANPPVLDGVPPPAGAPSGELTASVAYTLVPAVSAVDHLPYDPPAGDLDRVDYFVAAPPDEPDAGWTPVYSATDPPYAYLFIAAYTGDGVTPRPFPLWVRAVDTSTNESNVVRVDMVVLPNAPPSIGSVDVTASAPVAGAPYAGSRLRVVASGLDDPDGASLTVAGELRELAGGTVLDAAPAIGLARPPSGAWADLAPVGLEVSIPIDVTEGTSLQVAVSATDSHGATVWAEAVPFAVADDAVGPRVTELVVRRVSDGAAIDRAVIGESFVFELRADDVETGLGQVRVSVDRTDLFPDPVAVAPIAGSTDRFRSSPLTVPADLVTEPVQVVLTAEADDLGANTTSASTTIEVAPSDDPTAPAVELLTPWAGGLWPAGYLSVSGSGGTALLVRAHANDLDEGPDGNPVPGAIALVEVRGPEVVAGAGVSLAATAVPAELVDGSGGAGVGEYQVVWPVPDGIPAGAAVPFEVRVVDSGGHSVTHRVELTAVSPRRVYERVSTAVAPTDAMLAPDGDPDGAVFLLDGTTLSVYPEGTPGRRAFDALYLYAGGEPGSAPVIQRPTVLTVPEVTSGSSSVEFHPLQLSVSGSLGVGRGARIDVDGRGLQAETASSGVTVEGEIPAGVEAGGSHGGAGYGGKLDTYWVEGRLSDPGTTYGSVRYPTAPGSAGGGNTYYGIAGSSGGGVIRIDAASAAVHVAGAIMANGAEGRAASGAGGAGGSILITAATLRGSGEIGAGGGAEGDWYGPGGGGRVALHLGHADSGFDAVTTAHARGGASIGDHAFSGGAGTVFVQIGDEGHGTLVVVGQHGQPAAATPLASLGAASVTSVDTAAGTLALQAPSRRGSSVGEAVVIRGDLGDEVRFRVVAQQVAGDVVVLEVDAGSAELQSVADRLVGGEQLVARLASRFDRVVVAGDARLSIAEDLEVVAADGSTVSVNERGSVELLGGGQVRLPGEETSATVTTSIPPGSEIPVGAWIGVQVDGSDPLGVFEISRTWQADPQVNRTLRFLDQPNSVEGHTYGVTVPATASPGPTTLDVAVRSIDGRSNEQSLTWTVLENRLPSVTVAFAAGAGPSVDAGKSVPVVLTATDAERVASLGLSASGPSTPSDWFFGNLSGTSWTRTVTVTADAAADGLTPIVLIATATDSSGVAVQSAPFEIPVIADTTPPDVVVDVTPANPDDLFRSGDDVAIAVTASDDVALSVFDVSFDGAVVSAADGAFHLDWVAPRVDEATTYPIVVAAADPAGNVAEVTRVLTVEPSDDAEPPVLGDSCPQDGDRVVSGHEWTVRFSATDDRRLETVWLTVDGLSAAESDGVDADTVDAALAWSVPADAAAGTSFALELFARDYGGNVASRSLTVATPAVAALSGDRGLDGSIDGTALVLGPGTFTAISPLRPSSLELLGGAILTTSDEVPLVVEVAGTARVACDAVVDVSGRGYPEAVTYPGKQAPNSQWAGASHVGLGAQLTTSPCGEPYGSVTRPQEMGGGGQPPYGLRGGGAVRLVAQDLELAGDGLSIRADGRDGFRTGNWQHFAPGAGGSVWISVEGALSGSGGISASGGDFLVLAPWAAAGGGAVAVEFGATSGAVLGILRADGGQGVSLHGAPGSVFLRGPSAVFGDLLVDGLSVDGAPTVLTGLGRGTAPEGTEDSTLVLEHVAPIPPYFEGHWIEVRDGATGQVEGLWRIESVDPDGVTITLAAGDTTPSVDVGDSWRGVYRFDSLSVRGGAFVVLEDLEEIGAITVEPGSTLRLVNHGAPTVEAAAIELSSSQTAFTATGLAGAVTDTDGIASARIVNVATSEQWPLTVAPDGSFPLVEIAGTVGDEIRIVAVDGHHDPLETSATVGLLPDVNDGPPSLDPGLVVVSEASDGRVRVQGLPGVVLDEDTPITVVLRNLTAQTAVQDEIDQPTGGSFDLILAGDCDDTFELVATDTHTSPKHTTHALGTPVDLFPPVIDGSMFSVYARDGSFWVGALSDAVTDRCGVGSEGWVHPLLVGEPSVAVALEPDGGFGPVAVDWQTGTSMEFSAVDADGVGSRVPIDDPLPDNAGPPSIDPSLVDTSVGPRDYELSSVPACEWRWKWKTTIGDGNGLSYVAAENRSTPGFAPTPLTMVPRLSCDTHLDPDFHWWTGQGFEAVVVDGAVGDEIVLVATDHHPEPQTATAAVWTLPARPLAPQVDVSGLGYGDGPTDPLLIIAPGALVGSSPITVQARVWRDTGGAYGEITVEETSFSSGSGALLELPGAAFGDLVVVSATDFLGRVNRYRTDLAVVVAPPSIDLVTDSVSVGEHAGQIGVEVSLGADATAPASVTVATVSGTATPELDFATLEATVVLGPGHPTETVWIDLLDDTEVEGDENFQVVLRDPIGANLGTTTATTVTILDNESFAPRTVRYSVRPGAGELLPGPVAAAVTGGRLVLQGSPGSEMDRGDVAHLDTGESLLIGFCATTRECDVTTTDGLAVGDHANVVVNSVTPAFDSLADAVSTGDTLLGTHDLVSEKVTVELLLYGGAADTTPATVDGWTTSSDHRLRIVAPPAGPQRMYGQRHNGRWSSDAYRMEISGGYTTCLDIRDPWVTVEGIQVHCDGPSSIGVRVQVDAPGEVVIGESLVRLSTAPGSDVRKGIAIVGTGDVVVRSSVIHDLGDGTGWNHIGIDAGGARGHVLAVGNTIVGGRIGVLGYRSKATGGHLGLSDTAAVTAVNNIVTDATEACYSGPFRTGSRRNLAGDGTAPNPPAHHTGNVAVANPATGSAADFHLGCGVLDQAVAVTHAFPGGVEPVFDGDPRTVVSSGAETAPWIQLEFTQPPTVVGTGLRVTNCSEHAWTLEAADSQADLDSGAGSYRLLVDRRVIVNHERAWDEVLFPAPVSAALYRITVTRTCGDNVHLAEWELLGLNPACGAGANARADAPRDVDSALRVGPYDIGADQWRNLEVTFGDDLFDAWESEGEAVVEVLLSEFAELPVSVRYATASSSAVAGDDYVATNGELVLEPGDVLGQIRVPLVDDGAGEGAEELWVVLLGADGARVVRDLVPVRIHEGDPPSRLSFDAAAVTVSEAVGTVQVRLLVDPPLADATSQGYEVRDGTARIALDYLTAFGSVPVAAGSSTSDPIDLVVVDDLRCEDDESFMVELGWPDGDVVAGSPSRVRIRIQDDDLPSVSFQSPTADLAEDGGGLELILTLSEPLEWPSNVQVTVTGGTATEGLDFVLASTHVDLPVGATSGAVTLIPVDDGDLEEDETVALTISTGGGLAVADPATAVVTIRDDESQDLPGLGHYHDSSFVLEDGGVHYISVSLWERVTFPVSVDLELVEGGSATPGLDFVFQPVTLQFAPDDGLHYVEFTVLADDVADSFESFTVRLTNPSGAVIAGNPDLTFTIVESLDSDVTLDPAKLSLDLGGCRSDLNAEPGFFATDCPLVETWVSVWSLNGPSWMSGQVFVQSGDGLTLDIGKRDVGDLIDVDVGGCGGFDWTSLEVLAVAPSLDLGLVATTDLGGQITVEVTAAAVTSRLSGLSLRLSNDGGQDWVSLGDPCDAGGTVSATLQASSPAALSIQACHGVSQTVCTDWLPLASKSGRQPTSRRNGAYR